MDLASPGGRDCCIYRWPFYEECLLCDMLPEAARLTARVDDSVSSVCGRIPSGTKVFLFHLDVSRTANFPLCRRELIRALAARGIRVVNGDLGDVSKRALQRACGEAGLRQAAAAREGDPSETVIVKTDSNFGSWGERRLTRRERRLLGLPDVNRVIRNALDYRVLARRDVPGAWWSDPRLAIERFIVNRHDRIFKVYFLLDRLVVTDIVDPNLIKKAWRFKQRLNNLFIRGPDGMQTVRRKTEFPEPVLRDAMALATHISLEFGSLDLVMDDDSQVWVIDVNPTPGRPLASQDATEHLRAALNTCPLPGRRPYGGPGWGYRLRRLWTDARAWM